MEKYVRIFLMLVLSAMAGSSAYLFFNTARFIELEAYAPRFIEVCVHIEKRLQPVELATTSLHATTTVKRSSGSASPF